MGWPDDERSWRSAEELRAEYRALGKAATSQGAGYAGATSPARGVDKYGRPRREGIWNTWPVNQTGRLA